MHELRERGHRCTPQDIVEQDLQHTRAKLLEIIFLNGRPESIQDIVIDYNLARTFEGLAAVVKSVYLRAIFVLTYLFVYRPRVDFDGKFNCTQLLRCRTAKTGN